MRMSEPAPRGRWPRLALLTALLALASGGCGDGIARVPLFPAEGRVLVDGQPAKGVNVRLFRKDAPSDPDALRPFATSGQDGSFRIGTYEPEDGAPAGTFKATLFWPDRPPGPDHPNDQLGGQYSDPAKSEFELTIKEGKNLFEPIQAKKPAEAPRSKAPARPKAPDNDGVG